MYNQRSLRSLDSSTPNRRFGMTGEKVFKFFKDYFEIRLAAILVSIIAGLYLLGLLWSVLAGFSDVVLALVFAWFLAFILEPFVEALCRKGFSRITAALIVYFWIAVFTFLVIYLILPLTVFQLASLSLVLPSIFVNAPFWNQRFQEFLASSLSNSVMVASSVASFFFFLFIVLILSFYFLIDRRRISNFLLALVPLDFKDGLVFLNRVISKSIAGYIRIQIIFGVITAVFTAVLLFVLGVKFTLSAAFLAGVFTIIPAIGPFLAILPPVLAALVEGPNRAILVAVFSIVFQQVEFNVIGPKLMGNILKIHPIVVIISFVLGFKIAGAWGAVFSLPVASVVTVLGKELIDHWVVEKENVTRRVREVTRGSS